MYFLDARLLHVSDGAAEAEEVADGLVPGSVGVLSSATSVMGISRIVDTRRAVAGVAATPQVYLVFVICIYRINVQIVADESLIRRETDGTVVLYYSVPCRLGCCARLLGHDRVQGVFSDLRCHPFRQRILRQVIGCSGIVSEN